MSRRESEARVTTEELRKELNDQAEELNAARARANQFEGKWKKAVERANQLEEELKVARAKKPEAEAEKKVNAAETRATEAEKKAKASEARATEAEACVSAVEAELKKALEAKASEAMAKKPETVVPAHVAEEFGAIRINLLTSKERDEYFEKRSQWAANDRVEAETRKEYLRGLAAKTAERG